MAEVMASLLVEKVREKICFEEILRLAGLDREVRRLGRTLTLLATVLKAAEKQAESENQEVFDWLRRLKDGVYELEDLIDEFECLRLQDRVLNPGAKVRNFFSLQNPVAVRFKLIARMKNARRGLDEIAAMLNKSNLKFRSPSMGDQKMTNYMEGERWTKNFLSEPSFTGRDDDKETIVELLTQWSNDKGKNISTVSIYGLGGLGKTTLARMVYEDHRIVSEFDSRVWINLSEGFIFKRLIKNIIASITHTDYIDLKTLEQLVNCLKDLLQDKRLLLVLDGIWIEDRVKWLQSQHILMRSCADGSKILVTTRSTEVASVVASSHGYMYNLKGLSHEDCFSLLMKCACRDEKDEQYPNLARIGRQIVERCGGLPLAARVLGGLLYSKGEEIDWLLVRDGISESTQEKILISPALWLSYNALPSHLKHCFAFCSLYPKGFVFENTQLVEIWMAHGLIKEEDTGNQYINELGLRSFFEDFCQITPGVLYSFKMPDLVHDLALHVGGDDYVTINDQTRIFQQSGQHISLLGHQFLNQESEIVRALARFKHVQTILFPVDAVGPVDKSSITNAALKFKFMRVLDLRDSRFEALPKSIRKLKHLRYLNINNNTRIKALPYTIYKLYLLQTLLLDGCVKLEEMPRSIKKMTSLKHLEITTKQRAFPRNGMQRLTALETLWIVNCPKMVSLPKHLTALKTLSISRCDCLNLVDEEDDFKGFGSLQVFSVENLPELELLPRWLLHGPASTTLHSITIRHCSNFRALGELQNLKSLRILEIEDCPQLSSLPDVVRHLPSLRELNVKCCPALPDGLHSLISLKESQVAPKMQTENM